MYGEPWANAKAFQDFMDTLKEELGVHRMATIVSKPPIQLDLRIAGDIGWIGGDASDFVLFGYFEASNYAITLGMLPCQVHAHLAH